MSQSNVNAANKYARDVVAGDIPACKWIILACQRHLDDMRKAATDDEYLYYFDEQEAERVAIILQMFKHTKGKWAKQGKKLKLEPWQLFAVCVLFGWRKKKDNLRRFKRVLWLIPRKNGKSALAAAIAAYMLACDGEHGAEVYSGATSQKQAWEVAKPAMIMAKNCPEYLEYFGVQVHASKMTTPDGGVFEPIIAKPGDGSSPSLAIADEVHEHSDSDLVDTMVTGMGAREQPILLMVTTAGSDLSGPCFQYQVEAQKMLEGTIVDDEYFALIYTIDDDDDWTDPASLIKANPNYGVSVGDEYLTGQLQQAINTARKAGPFKTKHLNVWVGAMNAFFNIERWRQSADESLKLEDFAGQKAWVGLDLASKVDIAALEILIEIAPQDFVMFSKHYLPEKAIENGCNEHYEGWADDGYLTLTPGEIIDFDVIKEDIISIGKLLALEEVIYDPFQATMLVTELMKENLPCVEYGQTVRNYSEPMKQLDGLVRSRRIRHNGDPCMTWMMSNVVARVDAKDNVYPRKLVDANKIDGPVALIGCIGRAMIGVDDDLDDAIEGMISVTL